MLAGPAHLMTVGKISAEKRLLRADTVWEAKSPRTERNSTIQLGRYWAPARSSWDARTRTKVLSSRTERRPQRSAVRSRKTVAAASRPAARK